MSRFFKPYTGLLSLLTITATSFGVSECFYIYKFLSIKFLMTVVFLLISMAKLSDCSRYYCITMCNIVYFLLFSSSAISQLSRCVCCCICLTAGSESINLKKRLNSLRFSPFLILWVRWWVLNSLECTWRHRGDDWEVKQFQTRSKVHICCSDDSL